MSDFVLRIRPLVWQHSELHIVLLLKNVSITSGIMDYWTTQEKIYIFYVLLSILLELLFSLPFILTLSGISRFLLSDLSLNNTGKEGDIKQYISFTFSFSSFSLFSSISSLSIRFLSSLFILQLMLPFLSLFFFYYVLTLAFLVWKG